MAISVSPPPGPAELLLGATAWCAGRPCTTRHESPLSTERFQIERCPPVPCGPDTWTSPVGPILMSGSPYRWMGSTIRGTPKVIPPPLDAPLDAPLAAGIASATQPSVAPSAIHLRARTADLPARPIHP